MDQNAQLGVPIEIMIRIKPEPQQRIDLKVYENKISLLDQYDRAIDEFITNGAILETSDAIRSTFESTIGKYLGFVVHGVNLTIFTFGAKGSGKTFALQGNENESGVLGLLVESLFGNLESKHGAIIEEMQKLNVPEVEATTFTYSVRMKYVEIRDEAIIDLLQKYNYYKQPAQLVYSEFEGYTVNGAAWVALPNSMAFPDLLAEGEKIRSPFEYNKVTKNSTLLTIEITQTLDNKATKDVKVISSRINIFDLASADILAEHFRNLSNSIEYKSIYSFQNMVGDLAKTNNNAIPTIYDGSILTKLMKEYIGSNALCLGLFTLQNNNFAISAITFKMMKLCSRIQNYPILNDVNALGLLKKFRTDISYYSKFKSSGGYDLRPPIIPKGENELPQGAKVTQYGNMTQSGDNQALIARNSFLEKENQRLELALQEADTEKATLLKTIAELRSRGGATGSIGAPPMGGTGAMPPFMGDKYDVSDKLLHIEDDITETNQIMGVVNKLNDRFKILENERKSLAEEVEKLRLDNQNLTNELNKLNSDATNNKLNSDNELFNLKELLNSTKNELDYMRNEAEKYRKIQADLLLEIDEREVQYKKQLEDKEREIEMKMIDQNQTEKRRLEAEMREATRKIEHYGEENSELNKAMDELKKENKKLTLKNNELRATMRDMINKADEEGEEEISNKAKLMKTYTDRENELMENLGVQKASNENLKEKLKKMRTYARKARNIALDYFPPNEELPEMLTKDLNTFLEDAENESVIQFLEYEIRELRERNKKLQFEIDRLKSEFRGAPSTNYNPNSTSPGNVNNTNMGTRVGIMNNTNTKVPPLGVPNIDNLSEREIQKKILEEINNLKKNNSGLYPGQNAAPMGMIPNNTELNQEIMRLKNEINRLTEENRSLKTTINDTALSDIQSTADLNNPKAMRIKISFLEKTIEQLEKERSELNMRCTMAEEQLKNFQEMFNSTTQGYQKKILELNKRLEASNLRLNQDYLGAGDN